MTVNSIGKARGRISFAVPLIALAVGLWSGHVSRPGIDGTTLRIRYGSQRIRRCECDGRDYKRREGSERTAKTDQQGHFVFTELLPGTFVLSVDARASRNTNNGKSTSQPPNA